MTLSKQRFLPLDVFRGMTICFMIIVNNPGGASYWPLEHATFNGFTPTDLVFPSFLFAVGNAMSFSIRKYEEMGNAAFLTKVIKRTLLIFLIGYLLSWFPFFHKTDSGSWALNPVSHTRILGVLQRIALCYGIGSLLVHFLSRNATIAVSVLLLLGYWFLAWYFGQDGGTSPSSMVGPYTLHGNADLRLDRWVMGDNHLYRGEGFPFDPEGILSTLPAIVNVIAGYYTGLFIQKYGKQSKAIRQMLVIGVLLVIVAWTWNMVFPINKKIWTSSFVLNTVGLDLLILGALIYVIDFWKSTGWTGFFTTVGKNPLAIYILSELLGQVLDMIPVGPDSSVIGWIDSHIFMQISPVKLGSLLFAVTYMLACWSVGKILEWRKIYIRV